MGLLEKSLRDAFRAKVSGSPTVDRLADRVITQGRRARRRRTVVAGLAALLSVSLVGLAAAALARNDGAAPTRPDPTVDQPPQPQSPVDVLTGDVILTVDGATLPLDEVITGSAGSGSADDVRADAAWRVSDGWLVRTINYGEITDDYYGETERLWLVLDADHVVLIVTGHAIMVSPPSGRLGVQVAWVGGDTLTVGSYIGMHVNTYPEHPGMDGLFSTPIPQSPPPGPVRLHPYRAVGSAIVLAGTQTGGGLDTWGAWFPDRGDYAPTPYPTISMLGVTLDRTRIIATYHNDEQHLCLGELKPDGFTPVRSLCPSPFTDADRIFPSPDGRWWAVTGPNGTALYAADGIWEGVAPAYTWPIYSSTGTWSYNTFVTMRQEGVILIDDVNRSPDLLAVPLPLAAHGRLVEDLRSTQG